MTQMHLFTNMKSNMKTTTLKRLLISTSFTCAFLLLNVSLKAQNTDTTEIPLCIEFSYSANEIEGLKSAILQKGDKNAYLALRGSKSGRGDELLAYSMIMANKYHYPHAYYDVYKTIIEIADTYSTEMDSITLNWAIDYLREGASWHDVFCVYELSSLYLLGIYVEKNEEIAKSYFSTLYSGEDLEYRWKVFVISCQRQE